MKILGGGAVLSFITQQIFDQMTMHSGKMPSNQSKLSFDFSNKFQFQVLLLSLLRSANPLKRSFGCKKSQKMNFGLISFAVRAHLTFNQPYKSAHKLDFRPVAPTCANNDLYQQIVLKILVVLAYMSTLRYNEVTMKNPKNLKFKS